VLRTGLVEMLSRGAGSRRPSARGLKLTPIGKAELTAKYEREPGGAKGGVRNGENGSMILVGGGVGMRPGLSAGAQKSPHLASGHLLPSDGRRRMNFGAANPGRHPQGAGLPWAKVCCAFSARKGRANAGRGALGTRRVNWKDVQGPI
jgi:hypothetical protein